MTPAPAIALLCALLPQFWAAMPLPSTLPAQMEQETCSSLHSPKCFNPRAELRTPREYGFGLGQLTVTPSFNNFSEVKNTQPALKTWLWNQRFDAEKQIVALLTMDRQAFKACSTLMAGPDDALQCAFSVYNGGLGGLRADRRLCANTKGCDPTRWFGNVERVSTKAKVPAKGYGQSFYQINRGYVRNIVLVRRPKYEPTMACIRG
jgi:hypothetical protein